MYLHLQKQVSVIINLPEITLYHLPLLDDTIKLNHAPLKRKQDLHVDALYDILSNSDGF